MITGENTLPASGCTCKADLSVISGLVQEAWHDILREMIKMSFPKCCITNAIDGTEEDNIWEYQ